MQEKQRLESATRERRLEQIARLEEAAVNSLQHSTSVKEAEQARLMQEMDRRQQEREVQLKSLAEEEAILNLEFEVTNKVSEVQREQELQEAYRSIQMELDARKKKSELDDKLLQASFRTEDEKRKLRREASRRNQERTLQTNQLLMAKKEAERAYALQEMKHTVDIGDTVHQRTLRFLSEDLDVAGESEVQKKMQQEELLRREERLEAAALLEQQRRNLEAEREQRASILEEERRRAQLDNEMSKDRLSALEKQQRKREFEEKLLEEQQNQAQHTLEEERKLQASLLALEEQKRKDRQFELDLFHREQERMEKLAYQQALREAEETVVLKERARFQKVRAELRRRAAEIEKDAADQHREHMVQVAAQHEQDIAKHVEDIRRKVQLEEAAKLAGDHLTGDLEHLNNMLLPGELHESQDASILSPRSDDTDTHTDSSPSHSQDGRFSMQPPRRPPSQEGGDDIQISSIGAEAYRFEIERQAHGLVQAQQAMSNARKATPQSPEDSYSVSSEGNSSITTTPSIANLGLGSPAGPDSSSITTTPSIANLNLNSSPGSSEEKSNGGRNDTSSISGHSSDNSVVEKALQILEDHRKNKERGLSAISPGGS